MKKINSQHVKNNAFLENGGSFFREIQIELLVHDMKDPVSIIETGIRALLEKAEKYGPLSHRQEKTLRRILRNVKKTQAMLNDLLEIGRSEAGCFVCCRFAPARVVMDTLVDALETLSVFLPRHIDPGEFKGMRDFFSGYGIHLDIEEASAYLEVFQDEAKFRQIVGNLVKNALYYRKERIGLALKRDRDYVILEVTDDGPGIDSEHQEVIFKRYVQVNDAMTSARKGHGIGLAGAMISARSIGGDIQVNSTKGEGACFRMTLPISPFEC